MRYSVFWIESAVLEIEEIRQYHTEQGEGEYADKLRQALLETAQRLKQQPHRGKLMTKLGPRYREIFHRPYRIIYEVEEQSVYILSVMHTARDLRQAWAQRPRKRGT